jgi:hypothetical protein
METDGIGLYGQDRALKGTVLIRITALNSLTNQKPFLGNGFWFLILFIQVLNAESFLLPGGQPVCLVQHVKLIDQAQLAGHRAAAHAILLHELL